jgi:hypothetical protein
MTIGAIIPGSQSRLATCEPFLPLTNQALRVVDRIEREVCKQEIVFGPESLLRTIADFGMQAYSSHTDYYRRVIRETVWPHGIWVAGTHTDFIRGFEYSALGYVWGGFQALRFFAGGSDWQILEVYDDALVAESLRGQFGKSSPDGLDRRLLQLEDQFLAEYGDDNDLILLCTPVAPVRTAETALMEDFRVFRGIFPEPPTVNQILNLAGEHKTSAWQFLRRHVRWSVDAAGQLYQWKPDVLSDDESNRVEHISQSRNRLLAKLPKTAISLVDAITSLNILNLVLEPAFSFKGCVGLPLGMVFRMAHHVERRPPLDQVKLLLGKLNLFFLAQQRCSHE